MALAAQDLAERLARRAGGARHRLDRHASPGKIHNLSVECLAKLSAIPLDMLGAGQGRGMTGRAGAGVRRRHCISDRTAQAHRRRILEHVPALGYLTRLGRRCGGGSAIARAAITGQMISTCGLCSSQAVTVSRHLSVNRSMT